MQLNYSNLGERIKNKKYGYVIKPVRDLAIENTGLRNTLRSIVKKFRKTRYNKNRFARQLVEQGKLIGRLKEEIKQLRGCSSMGERDDGIVEVAGSNPVISNKIGDVTELKVAAKLAEKYIVLFPYGQQRYDLAFDCMSENEIYRVQCKTGRLNKGVITFNTRCSTIRITGPKTYENDADYFGVYCPENGRVYLIPVGHCPNTRASLRVEQSKNNQTKKVRFAKKYEI